MNKKRFLYLLAGLLSINPPFPNGDEKEIPYAKTMTPQQKRLIKILATVSVISIIIMFLLILYLKGYILR